LNLLIDSYLPEFITVFTITVLSVISPGPDFFIVVRNSLSFTRRAGIFTAIGVAAAIWVHILYTLAGIGLILSKSILLFTLVKYLGAGYLIFLGWRSLNSKQVDSTVYVRDKRNISDFNSFKMGFINNALNPKATLFFLSVFTQVVSIETPLSIQIVYGATASVSCLIWFSLVAVFLNHKRIKIAFEAIQHYFEKIMGAVLIGFGVKVAFTSQ